MRRGCPPIGALMAACATILVQAGCRGEPASPPADLVRDVFSHQAQEEGLTRVETDGRRLFVQYCATCHGETGAGDGQNAYILDPPPPDFHESLSANPPSYWRQIIEGGSAAVGRSPMCPPWGRTLAPGDIDALIAYLDVLARPPAQEQTEAAPQQGP